MKRSILKSVIESTLQPHLYLFFKPIVRNKSEAYSPFSNRKGSRMKMYVSPKDEAFSSFSKGIPKDEAFSSFSKIVNAFEGFNPTKFSTLYDESYSLKPEYSLTNLDRALDIQGEIYLLSNQDKDDIKNSLKMYLLNREEAEKKLLQEIKEQYQEEGEEESEEQGKQEAAEEGEQDAPEAGEQESAKQGEEKASEESEKQGEEGSEEEYTEQGEEESEEEYTEQGAEESEEQGKEEDYHLKTWLNSKYITVIKLKGEDRSSCYISWYDLKILSDLSKQYVCSYIANNAFLPIHLHRSKNRVHYENFLSEILTKMRENQVDDRSEMARYLMYQSVTGVIYLTSRTLRKSVFYIEKERPSIFYDATYFKKRLQWKYCPPRFRYYGDETYPSNLTTWENDGVDCFLLEQVLKLISKKASLDAKSGLPSED